MSYDRNTDDLEDVTSFFALVQGRCRSQASTGLNNRRSKARAKHNFYFLAGLEDPVLGQTREVQHRRRAGEHELEGVVPVADPVEAVAGRRGEAEIGGEGLAVEREGRPRERAGAQRTGVHALRRVGDPAAVPLEHVRVGEALMPEGHWPSPQLHLVEAPRE